MQGAPLVFVRIGNDALVTGYRVFMPHRTLLYETIRSRNIQNSITKVALVLLVLVQRSLWPVGFTAWADKATIDLVSSSPDPLLGLAIRKLTMRSENTGDWSSCLLLLLARWVVTSIAIIDIPAIFPIRVKVEVVRDALGTLIHLFLMLLLPPLSLKFLRAISRPLMEKMAASLDIWSHDMRFARDHLLGLLSLPFILGMIILSLEIQSILLIGKTTLKFFFAFISDRLLN